MKKEICAIIFQKSEIVNSSIKLPPLKLLTYFFLRLWHKKIVALQAPLARTVGAVPKRPVKHRAQNSENLKRIGAVQRIFTRAVPSS